MVAERLRRAIVKGELRSGDLLPREAELAASFGVAITTARAATRILETEDLLRPAPHQAGRLAVSLPAAEGVARLAGFALEAHGASLRDVYLARALVEPPAARSAAETRPLEAAARLRAHLAWRPKPHDDEGARTRAVSGFHRLLLQEGGNLPLALIGEALERITAQHMALTLRSRPTAPLAAGVTWAGYRSHLRLVDLIAAGDGDGAEAHWRMHMTRAANHWLKRLGDAALLQVADA